MKTEREQHDTLLDLVRNGNLAEYKRRIDALTKQELIAYILYAIDLNYTLSDIKLSTMGAVTK